MVYLISIKGHENKAPVKNIMEKCWEFDYSKLESFGKFADKEAQKMGIIMEISPTVKRAYYSSMDMVISQSFS